LLNGIPEINDGLGRLVRVLGWFAGGLLVLSGARWLWTHYGRDVQDLPGLVWGGVFFVLVQLFAHMALKMRGRPSFYG